MGTLQWIPPSSPIHLRGKLFSGKQQDWAAAAAESIESTRDEQRIDSFGGSSRCRQCSNEIEQFGKKLCFFPGCEIE